MTNILIVEDKLEVRISLRVLLEEEGYEVVEANNGKEGLAYINDNGEDIDAVITDIMMPEVDGIEFMTALKIMTVDFPVLVISGGGYQMEASEVLEAAAQLADNVLKKPFTQDELVSALKVATDNKGREQCQA